MDVARSRRRLVLDDPRDARAAARLLGSGSAVAHGFANIYAITARSDEETVRRVNLLKGRPAGQVGSLTTPPDGVLDLFDLDRLPSGLPEELVSSVVDALQALGPVGFRGPAASHVPDWVTSPAGDVTTTQVIVPGLACPSAAFLTLSRAAVGGAPLFITSANRSRHVTGAADAPAHWRAAGLRDELAGAQDLVFLEHADDGAALARFPRHRPTSTTIIGFHHTQMVAGRVCLSLERHGSLSAEDVSAVLARLGLGVTTAIGARVRLRPRVYPPEPETSVRTDTDR